MATKTAAHRSIPAWFSSLTLEEQISQAMPIARMLIAEGIKSDPHPHRSLTTDVLKLTKNRKLERWDAIGSEDETSALYEGFVAARALGIALGLMLRSEAFTDGAR